MAAAVTLPKAGFPIYVKSCPACPNFFAHLELALPGFTTDATAAEVMIGGNRFKSAIVSPLASAVSSRSLRMTLFTGRRCDFLAHRLIDFFVAPLTVFMQGVGMVLELPLF